MRSFAQALQMKLSEQTHDQLNILTNIESVIYTPMYNTKYLSSLIIPVLSLIFYKCPGQIGFIIEDTICIGDPVHITNTSRNAASYYWNFCAGNLLYTPQGENLNDQGTLSDPAFLTMLKTDEGYYTFITNQDNGHLTRNFYGENPFVTPVSDDLGNFGGIIPDQAKGIQVKEDNGEWYALITGGTGNESRLVRLSFGNSPGNEPAAENLGNTGGLNSPSDLYIHNEAGIWTGIITNYAGNSISRVNFGNSLANTPGETNLGNVGNIDKPGGLFPVFSSGSWYFFITNRNSRSISRVDFGNSLNNSPSGMNYVYDESLDSPYDMTIIEDCGSMFGFVVNSNSNNIVRFEFTDEYNIVAEYTDLGNIGELDRPHGISEVFRENDTLFMLIANAGSNSLSRLYFTSCDNSSLSSSTDREPPVYSYDQAGNYNISLVLDEGLPSREILCMNLEVMESPPVELGNDTIIQPGQTMELNAGEGYTQYEWSTGESSQVIRVSEPGIYRVTVSNAYGCITTDEIEVITDLHIPNFFTPNGDGINDRWEINPAGRYPEAKISIFDRQGKLLISYRGSDPGWDGKYKNVPVKSDSYWYVIDLNDGSSVHTGHVTLIR